VNSPHYLSRDNVILPIKINDFNEKNHRNQRKTDTQIDTHGNIS
jgi:hypothetical protein